MATQLEQQQRKSTTGGSDAGSACSEHALDLNELKALTEAAGFTANFETQAIKEAYIEFDGERAETVIEIEKNAKPAEIGLRYAKDVWQSGDNEHLKTSLRTRYKASSSLPRLREILNEQWQIETSKDGITIRIELKQRKLSVRNSAVQPEESNAVPEHEAIVQESPNKKEVESREMPTQTSASTDMSTQEKYSTYSRSEVDRMLKQQAENIAASLGGKIGAQTKMFQEAIADQERAFNKSIDKLLVSVDQFRSRLDSSVAAQQGASREQMEKFVSDVTKELEQFKTSLNKSILPSVKTLEEKLSSFESKGGKKEKSQVTPAPAASQSESQQNKMILWLVGASLITSVASVVLQLIHH
ncbi:MAG TPA: hypothetical protein V6C81_20360 [Planktothrix sp.]|jgi:hypothetical protein